ncbi:MAG: hypothetical protein ACI9RM_002926 [Ulvibacter sp.]|jgi:hypothetical protein
MIPTIQKNVFQYLSKQHPNTKSLISSLQTTLTISQSAAYKRINGNSPLSLLELEILITQYQIPAHVISVNNTTNVCFNFAPLAEEPLQNSNFIKTVHQELTRLSSDPFGHIIYTSIDVPFFYYFMYKELATFKLFHFKHSVSKSSVKQLPKIALASISKNEVAAFESIVSMYSKITSDEIWTSQALKITADEILYFHKMNLFQYPEEAILLLDKLLLLSDRLFNILSQQNKGLMINKSEQGAALSVNYNDFTRFNSVIIAQTNQQSALFLTYDIPNFLYSTNASFINYTTRWTKKLKQKAHPLSNTGEVQLLDFFNRSNDYILQVKNKIAGVLE